MKRRSRPALKIRLMVWEKASDKEFSTSFAGVWSEAQQPAAPQLRAPLIATLLFLRAQYRIDWHITWCC